LFYTYPQFCYPSYISSPSVKAKLDPPQRVVRRTGKKAGKTFGILCRSVLKIAEADSTSVFSGFFPVLLEHTVLWVKFRLILLKNPPKIYLTYLQHRYIKSINKGVDSMTIAGSVPFIGQLADVHGVKQ
jgi:hypothetical protein